MSLVPFFKLLLQISYSMFNPGVCVQLNLAASYIELTCVVHLCSAICFMNVAF